MSTVPTLRTARLTLRAFTLDDAPAVQRLVSPYEVALNTLMIPHPYPEDGAVQWISTHQSNFDANRIHHFAIETDGEIAGAMGLMMKEGPLAEIGYWIGVPYWNRGYATEAGSEVLRYGFEDLGLERVFAGCFARNPQSARVLQKLGMQHEGTLRRHQLKWGELLDIEFYGVLRGEWVKR